MILRFGRDQPFRCRLLNFVTRLSELARRIAVECGGVSPMTVDREEEEKAAAWEGEVTS